MTDHTDNIKGTLPLVPSSLTEETTDPIDGDQAYPIPVTTSQISHELGLYLWHNRDTFIGRGLPKVYRIVQDTELGIPHIWIHLQISFSEVSEATRMGIEGEIERFADRIERYFSTGFAISIVV